MRNSPVDITARHLLLELHGCDQALLDDRERLRLLMRNAAEAAGAHVVAEVFHPYAPHGVTGVLVIEESHFSLHTWPEYGYAAIDFYTCGECAPERAVEVLKDGLRAERACLMTVHRGLSRDAGYLRVAEKPDRAGDH
ncbi:MAG TPA: adenosylmethionine decarboxylase [Polyangiaceae bacterium]|nr:adenosylmethionine decarboxylase [Polyangiaceae bacterium]